MEQERLSKGIWIPIEIWQDKNLSWNEKILFLEIDSYTSSEQDCFFSNQYIAELLGISETNANKTLSSLISKGYVIKTKFDGRRRYVKTALSYTTKQPCQYRQPCDGSLNNNYSKEECNTLNKTTNKEKEKYKKERDELFEKCWIAYNRKGNKKQSKEQWKKLKDEEFDKVLPHIKAYVTTRERQFQRAFERYIRDRMFMDLVYNGNIVVYDPTRDSSSPYSPQCNMNLKWNDYYNCFVYTGQSWNADPVIDDGYTDEERPDGASIMLSNARGTKVWDSAEKVWKLNK